MKTNNSQFIVEPQKDLPVVAEYDVVVVGGGIAGVAAAAAASRNGASVCLLEKEFGLGGLATLGNVVIYLPLCDGMGHQVIKGLGEELLRLSVADGSFQTPACWNSDASLEERSKNRFEVQFNPMSYMLELEGFIEKNNIKLYYDSRFCDVYKNNGSIEAVIIENKEGRSTLRCKTVVDATGDADVCWRAGEETESWNSNVRCGWFYYFDGKEAKLSPFTKPYDENGDYKPDSGRGFAGDKADDVTEIVIESRKCIKERLEGFKRENEKAFPLFMSSIPTFRMTRKLKGAFELAQDDDKRYFDDAVGMTGDWRKKGPIYYIPFRALAGIRTKNLLTAGRCISVGKTAWDITRAIPVCAVTGEAAGTAAAFFCEEKADAFLDIKVTALQERLKAQGVVIDKSFAR